MWLVDPKRLERLRRDQRRQPIEATLQLPIPQPPPPPKQEPPAEDEPQRGVIVIDL